MKRDPEVVRIDEGFLVKHIDDVGRAAELVRDEWLEWYGDEVEQPPGRLFWCRILHCLPNSYGANEGWSYEYRPARGPARGVFRAVEFVL